MEFKEGDYVTRKSYNNDIVFKIIKIENDIYYLKGKNIRLYADSSKDDLTSVNKDEDIEKDEIFLDRIKPVPLDRDDYFYIPGKILHIDTECSLSK